jgi:membrane fusion protein (multidrug efflux system)
MRSSLAARLAKPLGHRASACLGGALAALVFGAGCGPDGAEALPEHEEATVVELTRVEAGLLRDTSTFGGQLEPENSVLLKPETDGVVESIAFAEGQRVVTGQELVRLRDREQIARLQEAKAMLSLAREVHERTRRLLSRNAASAAQRDEAAAELEVASARVALAQLAFDRTRILAPFDGVAGARLVSPGDRVTDETPLVGISAVDRLQVIFALSEHAVPYARPGVRVEVMVAPYPGERFPGEVFYVSPTLDPASRRLIMKAWVPNQDGRLAAGLFAEVDLEIGRRENAIVVPESAIVFDRQGTYVWRVGEDSVAERAPVETGLRSEGRVEVTLGLQPGDVIVSAGTHKVKEGRLLRAAESSATGQALRDASGARAGGEGT